MTAPPPRAHSAKKNHGVLSRFSVGAWNERYVEKSTVRFKGLRTEDQIRVHGSRKTQGGPHLGITRAKVAQKERAGWAEWK